ncbi:MAG: TIGR02646 family protein [Deltaproteobacteria bacterium]|nr:TIGR02646 family protein [Deltaproteobacteria bacterium]
MMNIQKLAEPRNFVQHRCQTNADFDNLPAAAKQELRDNLIREQGGLCCYCMSRISAEKSRIEHWQSQKDFHEKQLDYGNLLASCHGNKGRRREEQRCDVHKGDSAILYNPADQTHNVASKLRYLRDGTIKSTDPTFDAQLNDVLNLNLALLRDNRKRTVNGVFRVLRKLAGSVTHSYLDKKINEWKSQDEDGFLKEFCGVAIYFLEKRRQRV